MRRPPSRIASALGLALLCGAAFAIAPRLHAEPMPIEMPATTPNYTPEQRLERDEAARSQFLDLNFFAEGGGMHVSPNMLEFSEFPEKPPRAGKPILKLERRAYERRWGLNWTTGPRPIGLFDVPYKKMSVGVLGCVACHSGKAAGQFIVGIGNKNIDVYAIGRDAYLAERIWKLSGHPGAKDDDYKYVENSALDFSRTLANPGITNLTQGLVPTSVIRTWFYRQAGVPIPHEFHRAAVKVPALFGYGEKRKVGQFCDGIGNGEHPGWGIAVELVANQRTDVVRGYLPKIEAAEELLADFIPPKYPFFVDQVRATRGKELFERTCAHCHGTYETDAGGLPIYKKPKYVPWEIVRTDRDRLDGTTPEFLELVRRSPLNDELQTTDLGKGYFAPRLHAIWARFPYLHNGSVPSVAALLTRPEDRPRAFSLQDAGEKYRFDAETLGLTVPAPGSKQARKLLRRGKRGARDVYFVDRVGQSNQGHGFYTNLADDEKKDLIEYLKTL